MGPRPLEPKETDELFVPPGKASVYSTHHFCSDMAVAIDWGD